MPKTASITVRLEPDIKSMAEKIYSDFGITISDAINIFLHKSIQLGGLPFSMRYPQYNKTTLAAMQEANDISAGKIATKNYASAKELFDELDNEEADLLNM